MSYMLYYVNAIKIKPRSIQHYSLIRLICHSQTVLAKMLLNCREHNLRETLLDDKLIMAYNCDQVLPFASSRQTLVSCKTPINSRYILTKINSNLWRAMPHSSDNSIKSYLILAESYVLPKIFEAVR